MAHADYVCVDTEFMRESTYYPELCLIQIADDKEAAAIDPMAPGIDLKPLLDLLVENHDVLKVVHAGGRADRLFEPSRQLARDRRRQGCAFY
jgi:ribonuclease D